jgi:hypothetical protein
MKINLSFLLLSILLINISIPVHAAQLKPRMVVLTDISSWETDDQESLTRLLAHADLFEIEGIVITTGWSISDVNGVKQFIDIAKGVINAYEKDLPNLLKRSDQTGHLLDSVPQPIGYWPSAQYLKDRTMFGSIKRGVKYIGKGNDSEGSQLIIDLADEDDNRPLWITVWGGGNTLAQAIWKIKQSRSDEDFISFLHKLRVYTITDQDRAYDGSEGYEISSHQWLRKEFSEDLLFIWDERAWQYQNYSGGRDHWSEYETHIQNHGNLGKQYPHYAWGVEGDTPSFLHLLPNGLNDPYDPTQVGWGGYSKWGLCADNLTFSFTNHTGTPKTICDNYAAYFYPATFENFAARMDWAKDGKGNRNPVIVLDRDSSLEIISKFPTPGTSLVLDASATFDPEGDSLTFKWWIQPEAGSFSGKVEISNSNSSIATISVPSNSAGKSFHVICEVTDNGIHNLSSYRRIIIKPIIGQKPVVQITSPAHGAMFSNNDVITITADASDSDGTVASVEFFHGPTSLGIDTSAPFSVNWNKPADKYYSITARVTDNEGNVTTSDPVTINVTNKTGIDVLSMDYITFYPNPVKDELNVKSEHEFNSIRIFNLEGKLILDKRFNETIKSTSLKMFFTNGVYLLVISNSKETTYSKFIVE